MKVVAKMLGGGEVLVVVWSQMKKIAMAVLIEAILFGVVLFRRSSAIRTWVEPICSHMDPPALLVTCSTRAPNKYTHHSNARTQQRLPMQLPQVITVFVSHNHQLTH